MAKNLVLCLDGTSNKFDDANTNVVQLYQMLPREAPDQVCYYQPGIGTIAPVGVWSSVARWWVTRLDLAIAWLLEEHVTSAYRFLMRYYEPSDHVYLFGFSRGSYTARVLAGMLHKVGLLSRGNDDLVPFAWDTFAKGSKELAADFKTTFARPVRIHFLGVWDTVSSVGWALLPKHYPYTKDNPSVATVRHALAIDERRTYFVANHWTDQPRPGQDAREVWFAGVHCDVGGGYPQNGLAKVALSWMTTEAETHGLRTDPTLKSALLPEKNTPQEHAPDVAGSQHESLHGPWWFLEYLPKLIKDPVTHFQTWHFIWPRGRRRYIKANATLHASVLQRLASTATYRPPNLPAQLLTAPPRQEDTK